MVRSAIGALVLAIALMGCATKSSVPAESAEVGGIDGAPIQLDAHDLDPKYRDYFARVVQMIKEKWFYPCVDVKYWFLHWCDYKATEVAVEFGILKGGQVSYVIVRKPSEFPIYNEFVVDALNRAAPFPPIPETLAGERTYLPIRVTFKYIPWPRP